MQNSAFLTWGMFMLSSTLIASGVHAETERRTFEVATGEGFVLDADWGEVEVRTWDRAAIDVVVERADKVDLEYDQHNGTLTVRSRKKDKGLSRWFGERGRSPAFRISVPSRTDLSLATQGGNVSVDDHEGEVIAHTSGGKIVIGEVNGNVDGRTSGGSIAIAGATGSVKATTSGGTIRLGRAGAAVEATTVGGSIHVEHAKGPKGPSTPERRAARFEPACPVNPARTRRFTPPVAASTWRSPKALPSTSTHARSGVGYPRTFR